MTDITKPAPPQAVAAYAPVRERVNTSRAFASGVAAWDELEAQCNQFEALAQDLRDQLKAVQARNEILERENVRLTGLYEHHKSMRIQCAAGLKNLLDLANAIAIRESLDTVDPPPFNAPKEAVDAHSSDLELSAG